MIRYLTLVEVLDLHRQIIEQSGGSTGIRDLGAVESAIAQPRMTFGGTDLYPTIVDKASVLGFSIAATKLTAADNRRSASPKPSLRGRVNRIGFPKSSLIP